MFSDMIDEKKIQCLFVIMRPVFDSVTLNLDLIFISFILLLERLFFICKFSFSAKTILVKLLNPVPHVKVCLLPFQNVE